MIHSTNKRPNPYIGPRAFKYGETLYGRDREVLDLLDLLIAERIILLHSPSGAGKTSLIQSALIPQLEKEDFHVLPVMRVSLEPPERLDEGLVKNRYVFSLLLSLEEGLPKKQHSPLVDLAQMTLADYFDRKAEAETDSESDVLIFDQFEEVLTLNPTDKTAKKEFFVQLGRSLRNRNRWAIFALREEYVASLHPYLPHIPTGLNNTFRLELLGEESARQAMQEPARANGVEFTDAAARKMVDDLRRAWVQQPDGSKKPELGPYVEPVQLQVVCLQLWGKLPSDDWEIGEDDVKELGDVDSALASFYDEQATAIAKKEGTKERFIREWFQDQLITEQGIRRDVLQGQEKSQGLDNQVIWSLVDTHLVRAERRRGFTWFELAHDRLIEPVRASNAAWFKANLSLLQRQAALWEKQGRPAALLLSNKMLAEVEQWVNAHSSETTDTESEFLDSCQKTQAMLNRERRQRLSIRGLVIASILLVIFLSYLGFTSWSKKQPWAYLRNITTGKVHALRGSKVTIGRNTDKFKNDIHLRPRNVSRLHLFILNNHVALDMRSLNGTTVNGVFLPYGTNIKLRNDDIIVLTGAAPFRYETSNYPAFYALVKRVEDSSPPPGWGMLIDGKSRSIIYMKKPQYYLSRDEDNRYLLLENDNEETLLTIRKYENGIVKIQDRDDDIELIATMKEGDYDYNEYKILPGREYYTFNTERKDRFSGKMIPESHDIFEVAYKYGDNPFQIVPVVPDLETEESKNP